MLRQFVSKLAPRKHCLVADSSLPIRKAAASILRDLRFHVTEAESNDEALMKIQHQTPDAVLVDGNMAELDGFAFVRALAETGPAGSSKIILCTTARNPSQIARAIGAGAHEYVIKPFDRTILVSKFEQLGLTN